MKSQIINLKLKSNATLVIALVASINFACGANDNAETKKEYNKRKTQEAKPQITKPDAVTNPVTNSSTSPSTSPSTTSSTPAPVTSALADDGRFLKLTDLEAPTGYKLNSLEGDMVINSINDVSFVYNASAPGLPVGSDDPNDCMKVPATVKWVANKESAKIGYTMDVSNCEQKKDTESTYFNYSQVWKAYTYITCVGADLSSLNGKSINESFDFSKCAEFSRRSEMRMDLNTNVIDAKGTHAIWNISSVMFYGSEGLGSCKSKINQKIETIADGCLQVSRTAFNVKLLAEDTVVGESKDYDIQKLSSKGIVNNRSDALNKWSSAGSISVEQNDWTGSVVYDGGQVNPSYTVKNATRGEIRTGKVSPAASK